MGLWNFLKTGHWDSKTKRIAKEEIKLLTKYMVGRLEAIMDYYKNNEDEKFHFAIIIAINWVKDKLKTIVNESNKGSKLKKSIIKFQKNSGLEMWDKEDDQKNYLREDNIEKRIEILKTLSNGPEKSDKFYSLWNKEIKGVFKNIYDLFINKINDKNVDFKTKRIAKEEIKLLTKYMVGRLEAIMDYYKNNEDEKFHFAIIIAINWVKDKLKTIVNESNEGSKLAKSIIKFQKNSGLETWDKEDDQKNYLREDNIEKRIEILKTLFNGPEKSDKFYSLWNKKIKNVFKKIYDLFIDKIKGSKEIVYLNFDQKLEKALAPIKFDPTCAAWMPIVLTIALEKLNRNEPKESKLVLLGNFIEAQAIIELFYILRGKYPTFATKTFTKIRNKGINACDKFNDEKASDFLRTVDKIIKEVSPLIKKKFSKISTKIINEKFKKNFPDSTENDEARADLAKMRIGWLLLSENEKKEELNNFWKQLEDAKIEINDFINK